jgi:hypothetical protein
VVVLTKRGAVAFSLCVRGPPSWNATEVGEDGGPTPPKGNCGRGGERERRVGKKEGALITFNGFGREEKTRKK